MTVALFAHLTSRALIAVRGPDWRSFLQNLLSNDVDSLADGELRAALLLTPQGKYLFDLFVTPLNGEAVDDAPGEDGAILDVAADRREALIGRLKLYRLRAKVAIEAMDGGVYVSWGGSGVPGDGWMPDPRLPALGWRAYGLAGEVDTDEDAYDAHRLALGVPDPAKDATPDQTFPLEANWDLLNAIDFHKGCYIGQETTSRMKRRSAVKTRMAPIDFTGPAPPPGTPVLTNEGLRAGEVLSGREGRALALLRLDRAICGGLTARDHPVHLATPNWWPDGTLPSIAEPEAELAP
jgi:folate-binding protein YgfZ